MNRRQVLAGTAAFFALFPSIPDAQTLKLACVKVKSQYGAWAEVGKHIEFWLSDCDPVNGVYCIRSHDPVIGEMFLERAEDQTVSPDYLWIQPMQTRPDGLLFDLRTPPRA